MKAKVKNLEIEVQPMTKYEYNNKIMKIQLQHSENKWVKGYYCNWNDYKFWLNEDDFNKIYTIENDKKI